MTIEQAAERLQLDLTGALSRFLGNQALYLRFLKKFPADSSMEELRQAFQKENLEGIEKAAHSLKGVCANLGLKNLAQICNDIVQAVRGGKDLSYLREQQLLEQCEGEYETICEVVKTLE